MGEKRNARDEMVLDLLISLTMVQIIGTESPLHKKYVEKIDYLTKLLGGDKDEST